MDIRQLADVFEAFRRMSLTSDGLDPVHYITTPGMSFDAALKFCHLELELLQDPEMYRMFEDGTRGGMTFVKRHIATANHPGLGKDYNPERPQSYLIPVDANNLYGHALSTKLPWRDFRFETFDSAEHVEHWLLEEFDSEGDRGFILTVDLAYPKGIHDHTSDLPLAPEKKEPQWSWMPPYQQQLWSALMIQRGQEGHAYGSTPPKLLLTCHDKVDYTVHARILQFYLRQGMRLKNVHRILSFQQDYILEPYIRRNSERRAKARNEFEKDYNKLLNNSLFGKTMENVRKRVDYRLVNSAGKLEKLVAKPAFREQVIFNEELVLVHMLKTKVVLNKPVYIGQCVLDNSKLIMYELWYRQLKPLVEQKPNAILRLLGGDTDSFFLHLENADAEGWFLPELCRQGLLDTSNYPRNHPLFSNDRKAKLGCIKDESDGVANFQEWILLRPKLYSFAAVNPIKDKRRAKGVQRAVVKNDISHRDYRETLDMLVEKSWLTRRIASELHELYTVATLKRALSFWEDKRAWVSTNESLPYGHYRLESRKRPYQLD